MNCKTHARINGVIFLIYAVLFFCLGGFFVSFPVSPEMPSEASTNDLGFFVLFSEIGKLIVWLLIGISIFCGILFGAAGISVWFFNPFARIFGLITSIFSLLLFPFGTITGSYGIWFFSRSDAKDFYNGKI